MGLPVVAVKLVANRGCTVVGSPVAHLGKDFSGKVDAALPSVGFIVSLIVDEAPMPDDLPIQAMDVNGVVVAASQPHCQHVL